MLNTDMEEFKSPHQRNRMAGLPMNSTATRRATDVIADHGAAMDDPELYASPNALQRILSRDPDEPVLFPNSSADRPGGASRILRELRDEGHSLNEPNERIGSRGLFNGSRPGRIGNSVESDPSFHEIDQLLQRPGGGEWFVPFETNRDYMSLDPYQIDNDDDSINHEIASGLALANGIIDQNR